MLCALLVVVIASFALTQQCPPSKSDIENNLQHAHIAGLAALVINRTSVVYDEAFGYHSPLSHEHPMDTSRSIFVLASLSKTFIALATMQLVELDLIDLDQDVNDYLKYPMRLSHPLFPEVSITMRHVLSHSTGLGSNYEEDFTHAMSGDDYMRANLTEVVLRYLMKNASWLPETPGNVTYYSNINAAWGALVVERVSGLSFENYVRLRILNALHINQSEAGYRLADFATRRSDLVEQYVYNQSLLTVYQQIAPQLHVVQAPNSSEWLYIPPYGISVYPSAMLRMSAYSLSIYLRSFLNDFMPNLLQKSDSVEEMLRIVRQQGSATEPDVYYGLIWNWRRQHGRRLVGHRGWMPGVTHTMMLNEERTLGVILLSTGDITWGDNLAENVSSTLNHFLDQLFDCFEGQGTIAAAVSRSVRFELLVIPSVLSIFILDVK